jgi:hypothetical protein
MSVGSPTVVRSVLLAADQVLRVEQLAVVTGADLVDRLRALAVIIVRDEQTEGSRSTKMERGTYLPLPVSLKKVSKEPPSTISLESGSRWPSALRPCSRR